MNAAFIKLFHSSTNPANLVKISPIVSEIKWLIGQSIKKIKIKKNIYPPSRHAWWVYVTMDIITNTEK